MTVAEDKKNRIAVIALIVTVALAAGAVVLEAGATRNSLDTMGEDIKEIKLLMARNINDVTRNEERLASMQRQIDRLRVEVDEIKGG